MSGTSRWREFGHLERAVRAAGDQDAFDVAVSAMLDEAQGWRLAGLRKRCGMPPEQVARWPGVSQIDGGDMSAQDVSRFVAALGGTLKLIADFGDEQLKLRSPDAATGSSHPGTGKTTQRA